MTRNATHKTTRWRRRTVSSIGAASYLGVNLGLTPNLAPRSGFWPRSAQRSPTTLPRISCNVILLVLATPLNSPDELELCEKARAGSRVALGQLLERHGPRLYRSILLPRLGSADAAQEALGITYSKVVERFSQFEWKDVGIYPWLRKVALRVAIDQLKAKGREVLFAPSDLERELESLPVEAQNPEQLEERDLAVARQRVVELLDRIHPRYADAIRVRVLEGRDREESAEALGVTAATFDVVLHRALVALRKIINAKGIGAP